MMMLWILLLFLPLQLCAAEDAAFSKYREGEHATSPSQRKAAFNDALTLYLKMESESPSAVLLYDIGNTYYQLHEYGYAILYYERALKENPRFSEAKTNLQIALNKVNIAPSELNFIQNYLLFFHYKLNHDEKATAVLVLLFLAFALLSVHLWMPQDVLKKLAYIALWVTLILFSSIIWADYLATPRAIVVRPVALRRDAGDQYAPIVGTPVLVGTSLSVISVKDDGNWLKVRTASGEVGYISKEYARTV
jgi:hypothetical protein